MAHGMQAMFSSNVQTNGQGVHIQDALVSFYTVLWRIVCLVLVVPAAVTIVVAVMFGKPVLVLVGLVLAIPAATIDHTGFFDCFLD